MIERLLDHFPDEFTPHPQQEKVLNNIEQAFNEGYKFVVVTAPTGSGKSHVAKTLGNATDNPSKEFVRLIESNLAFKMVQGGEYEYHNECMAQPTFGAFVLTITKSLQDQYATLFEDVKFMKGKSNYICAIDDEFTVDMAPCLLVKSISEDCICKKICPYYNARAKALTSKISALNYKMFFSLPEHVKQREYIICDEAAELEDELVKHFTCNVNFQILKKLGVEIGPLPLSEYSKYQRWAESLLEVLFDRIEELKVEVKSIDKSKQTKYKKWIRVLQTIKGNISTLVETFYESEYQVEKGEHDVTFTPLKVNRLSRYLFDHGKKIVLMSATIIDHQNYCKTLGIDKYKYIEVGSPFDAKKAPIYCSTTFKLNYKNIDTILEHVIEQVRVLCEQHKDQKGIIHTHSNKITKAVRDAFMLDSRFLYREDGISNEHILNLHDNTDEPTVLVSPSMSHGVDLKGNLAEFQIIMKAPYSPLGDIRIKKMFELDKQWYSNKMLCSVIQACGRGIRSKSDECVTYILDGTITDAIKRNRSRIPKYFLERFQ
jgi:ATP-dependent DNA helicase DinG